MDFSMLPSEVLVGIAAQLSIVDVVRLLQTSATWRDLEPFLLENVDMADCKRDYTFFKRSIWTKLISPKICCHCKFLSLYSCRNFGDSELIEFSRNHPAQIRSANFYNTKISHIGLIVFLQVISSIPVDFEKSDFLKRVTDSKLNWREKHGIIVKESYEEQLEIFTRNERQLNTKQLAKDPLFPSLIRTKKKKPLHMSSKSPLSSQDPHSPDSGSEPLKSTQLLNKDHQFNKNDENNNSIIENHKNENDEKNNLIQNITQENTHKNVNLPAIQSANTFIQDTSNSVNRKAENRNNIIMNDPNNQNNNNNNNNQNNNNNNNNQNTNNNNNNNQNTNNNNNNNQNTNNNNNNQNTNNNNNNNQNTKNNNNQNNNSNDKNNNNSDKNNNNQNNNTIDFKMNNLEEEEEEEEDLQGRVFFPPTLSKKKIKAKWRCEIEELANFAESGAPEIHPAEILNNLQALNIGETQVTSYHFYEISKYLPNVTDLNLSHICKREPVGLLALGHRLPKLKAVTLFNNWSIHRDALSSFFLLRPNLTYVCLRSSNLSTENLEIFSQHNDQLRYIDLSSCSKITEKGLNPLFAKNHHLEVVKLRCLPHINLAEALLFIAQHCTALHTLDISASPTLNPIEALLAVCTQCKALVELGLRDVPVNDECVIQIARHGNVERLDLTMCVDITDFALFALGEHCRFLERLDLQGICNLSDQGFSALVESNRALLKIDLQNCIISGQATLELLRNSPLLNKLNLQNCSMLGNLVTFIKQVQEIHKDRTHYLAVYLKGVPGADHLDLFQYSSERLLFWNNYQDKKVFFQDKKYI